MVGVVDGCLYETHKDKRFVVCSQRCCSKGTDGEGEQSEYNRMQCNMLKTIVLHYFFRHNYIEMLSDIFSDTLACKSIIELDEYHKAI